MLQMVSRLREHGVSVILVTHNMDHLVQVADRVTVMRLGRTIATRTVGQTTPQEIVGLITGAIMPDITPGDGRTGGALLGGPPHP